MSSGSVGIPRDQEDVPPAVERGDRQRWMVVNTQNNQEALAANHLQNQGFQVYCPMILKRISHARRVHDALRPLFPGYLFVELPADGHWRSILGTVAVRSLMRSGNEPLLLRPDLVNMLKAQELNGAVCCKRPQENVASKGGDLLKDKIKQIVELQEKDRVMVLHQLLQAATCPKAQSSHSPDA